MPITVFIYIHAKKRYKLFFVKLCWEKNQPAHRLLHFCQLKCKCLLEIFCVPFLLLFESSTSNLIYAYYH